MITREQYETEIGRLQDQIVKEQDDYNYHYNRQMVKPRGVLTTDTKYGNAMCKGGGNACWDHINRSANAWKNMQPGLTNKIESAKQSLWDYQKQVAQDEQEAQIKAMRKAIADQVRLEQEKIIQSEENQQIIINEPIQTTEPTQTTEPIKEKSIALGSLSLIGILIGGFLVLRP